MNLGDGIYQHEPNEVGMVANGIFYPTTGPRFNLQPYRLIGGGHPGRFLMESATVPGTGTDYPGIDYTSGAPSSGDWWAWVSGATGWPNEYTLVIEGCTHDGTTITEGTRYFLRYWAGGTSPAPIANARPYFTVDGTADNAFQSRLGLGDPDNWEHKTSGLPSLTIDGARLYKSFFNREPLIGTTISNPYTPIAGATTVTLSGFTWKPASFAQYQDIINGDRIGAIDQFFFPVPAPAYESSGTVVKFGTDPVRYRLRYDSHSEPTPGNFEVDYDLDPPLLARTAAELPGAVTWLPRHEIPTGKPFDIRLDVYPVVREKWNGAAYVSSDSPEQLIYNTRLFYSPFES